MEIRHIEEHEQLSEGEVKKLLTFETLELYILQSINIKPLVNVIDDVVRFVNDLSPNYEFGGFGRYIINSYDGSCISFHLFNFDFSYELYAKESSGKVIRPYHLEWSLEYYLWSIGEDSGDPEEMLHDGDNKPIAEFDFTNSNESEPVIRCIVSHLTIQIGRILRDRKPS